MRYQFPSNINEYEKDFRLMHIIDLKIRKFIIYSRFNL